MGAFTSCCCVPPLNPQIDDFSFSEYDYSTPLFNLMDEEGSRRPARLVGAHDGDTISVIIEWDKNKAARFNIRLYGIDTPEMSSKDPTVKELSVKARNRLISILTKGQVVIPEDGTKVTRNLINTRLCENVHMVFLECKQMDKYGRVLAKVYPDNLPYSKSSNQIMLDEGLAKPYSGRMG